MEQSQFAAVLYAISYNKNSTNELPKPQNQRCMMQKNYDYVSRGPA